MNEKRDNLFLTALNNSGDYLTTPGKAYNSIKYFKSDIKTEEEVKVLFTRFKKIGKVLKDVYGNDAYMKALNNNTRNNLNYHDKETREMKVSINYGNEESNRDDPLIIPTDKNKIKIHFSNQTLVLAADELIEALSNDNFDDYITEEYKHLMERQYNEKKVYEKYENGLPIKNLVYRGYNDYVCEMEKLDEEQEEMEM